ncbi:MAG TPA: YncE family protein [Gammaproteobacteria bacterium]|jgi:YVTN family beta-propeller protein
MRSLVFAAVIALSLSPAFAADSTPHYKLAKSYLLGGDGGWDYLTYDPAGRHLFISRGTEVQVLDVDTGKVVATIPDTNGVHGIALAPELNKGFVSDGKDDAVTVFDMKTLKVTNKVKIEGDRPDAIAYEPKTQRVFTFDGGSNDSTLLDAKTDKVVATVKLPGRPEAAVADGQGRMYVNIESTSQLSAIDAAKAVVLNTWSLAPACDSPSAIAMDTAHRRLFSGCHNKVMAISDADTGKVIGTQPIGEGVDAGSFDAGLGLVFMSCGEGLLSVIHEDSPDHYSKVEDAPTKKYARTMALDPKSHDVYLVTADIRMDPAPAAATGRAARPKRTVLPDSFTVLVMHRD